jgi:hypothetical protein
MAVKTSPLAFHYASSSALKFERTFVLTLVEIDGRVLEDAADHLQRDEDEVLAQAIANNSQVLAECFSNTSDDFHFSCFISDSCVREKLVATL